MRRELRRIGFKARGWIGAKVVDLGLLIAGPRWRKRFYAHAARIHEKQRRRLADMVRGQ
ncbi:hypothetical protein [Salipiger mucosus]|uniref:hypothetical protein n=1 Tax=Salipiger mucosus TaxID=263378 RepID=UPI0012ECA2B6|nr:hypothetical protein [Salipiger mucosus]